MVPKSAKAEHVNPTRNGVVDHALHHIEVGLVHDDPEFVRRMRRLERAENVHALTVFALLAASAVLLLVGLATQTRWLWGGHLALIAAFGVDHRHRHKLSQAADR